MSGTAAAFRHLPNNTRDNWWQDRGMRKLAFLSLVGLIGAVNTGYDASLINGLNTMKIFSAAIDHASGGTLGFMTAAYSLGVFIGMTPAALFSDRFGRKWTVLGGAIFVIAGGLVQGLTKGVWHMMAGRLIVGLGAGWQTIGGPTLVAEISHPRNRSQVTALIHTCWYIGSIVSAWTTYGTLAINNDWCWRIPCLLQVAQGVAQVCLIWFCPESPRFLISRWRDQEAHDMLAKYHANGDKDDPLVLFEIQQIKDALEFESTVANNTSYTAFFRTKGNRRRLTILVLLGLLSNWIGMGVISYYLSTILSSIGITNSHDQAAINGGLQIWNWFIAVCGALLVEKLGRRPLWLISTGGMLVTFIVITIGSSVFVQHHSQAAGYVTLVFIFLMTGFYDIAYTPMVYSYPVEIMPYGLRAKGLGISQGCVYASAFFNQFVNPIALKAIAWKYYILYIVMLCVMLNVIWFLFPETKGRTLEQIAEIFDGEAAEVHEVDTLHRGGQADHKSTKEEIA